MSKRISLFAEGGGERPGLFENGSQLLSQKPTVFVQDETVLLEKQNPLGKTTLLLTDKTGRQDGGLCTCDLVRRPCPEMRTEQWY